MKTIFVVTAVGLVFGASLIAHADPAMVIDPAGPCILLDGDANLVVTRSTKVVVTQSANGNAQVKCHADVAPASNRHAANFNRASSGGNPLRNRKPSGV